MAKRDPLICFDLGGVLVRICRSWEEGCAAAGLEVRPQWRPSQSRDEHMAIVGAYTIGRIECGAFFSAMERISGGVYSADEFRRVHDAWLLGAYEGAAQLVDEVRSRGLSTACLSNTNHAHWERLVRWPEVAALEAQHASHLLGAAKPDESIYEQFEREVGRRGDELVFFDDLADNIETAKRRGWRAVRIDHTGDTAAQIRAALAELKLLERA